MDRGGFSVLEIDERKAVSVNAHFGLVYVVERKDKPGKQFASLNFIPAKDLRLRSPHPQYLKNRRDTILRKRKEQAQAAEGM